MKILGNILYYGLVFPFLIHMIYRGLTYPFRGGERRLQRQLDSLQTDRAKRVDLFKCMLVEDYGYFMGPLWYYKQDHASYVSIETIEFAMFFYDLTAQEVCEIMSLRRFTLMDVPGIDETLGTNFSAKHPSSSRNEGRIREHYHGVTDRGAKKPKTIGELIEEHIGQHETERCATDLD